jgi:hypothetical protein
VLHFDALGLYFIPLWQVQSEHPCVIDSLDLIRFNGAWKRDAPAKRAIAAFTQVIALVFNILVFLGFPFNGQDICVICDLNVVRFESGYSYLPPTQSIRVVVRFNLPLRSSHLDLR